MMKTKSSAGPALRQKHVVVVVDDEQRVLAALRRLLRGEPYELLTTENPAEALRWLEERPVSVLISDHRMPQMSGTDLLRLVRERSPKTTRIILTGYPDSATVQGRADRRIHRLITKPWSEGELRHAILQVLQQRESGTESPDVDYTIEWDVGGEGG
jgi:response regulator RpfG family c-di-GMP phosphodiesterase